MSAHKIPISQRCDGAGCPRAAKWIVRNTYNAEHGRYCTPHADQMVAELQKAERL